MLITTVVCVWVVEKKANIFQEEAGDNPVRQSQTISISHTPRVFPTPLRESVAPNEEEVSTSVCCS